MSSHASFQTLLAVALVSVTVVAPTSAASQKDERHCVVRIEPVQGLQQFSKMSEMRCFKTVAEAVHAATGGKVRLPAETRAANIDGGTYGAHPDSILIGMDYTEPNFGGSSLQWTAPTGCFSNGTQPSYSAPSMPFGWDNVISSAKSFSNCHAILYYDLANYGGLSLVTGCQPSSLSFMDNKTSSHQWSDQRYGQFCPF